MGMYTPALMAFVHHLAAFALVAAVTVEFALFKPPFTVAQARRIQRADIVYGLSAGLILAVGALRAFIFEKGTGYYLANDFFRTKIGLFVLVGLLSVYPTVVFFSWGKALKQNMLPELPAQQVRRIRGCLMLELAAIAVILLCAAFMADGWGSAS